MMKPERGRLKCRLWWCLIGIFLLLIALNLYSATRSCSITWGVPSLRGKCASLEDGVLSLDFNTSSAGWLPGAAGTRKPHRVVKPGTNVSKRKPGPKGKRKPHVNRRKGIPKPPVPATPAKAGQQERVAKPPRFALYRIIGNDMPPLQSVGQLRWNTEYILKHEPLFPDCRKRWVLNRIANVTEKALLKTLLEDYGTEAADIIDIPFDVDKLIEAESADGARNITLNPILRKAVSTEEEMQGYGRRIRDYMGLNQGRNKAIQDGLMLGARWIMCFDANQFLPQLSWMKISQVARRADAKRHMKYIEVPMVRLKKKQSPSWLHGGSSIRMIVEGSEGRMEEGQIIFRNDSDQRFNENMAYSLAPKQDLLDRTCSFASTICACHDKDWWWKINTHRTMVARIAPCGVSVRLWSYPEEEALSIKVGDGNARREMRIKSARRYVAYVQQLIEARKAELELHRRQLAKSVMPGSRGKAHGQHQSSKKHQRGPRRRHVVAQKNHLRKAGSKFVSTGSAQRTDSPSLEEVTLKLAQDFERAVSKEDLPSTGVDEDKKRALLLWVKQHDIRS